MRWCIEGPCLEIAFCFIHVWSLHVVSICFDACASSVNHHVTLPFYSMCCWLAFFYSCVFKWKMHCTMCLFFHTRARLSVAIHLCFLFASIKFFMFVNVDVFHVISDWGLSVWRVSCTCTCMYCFAFQDCSFSVVRRRHGCVYWWSVFPQARLWVWPRCILFCVSCRSLRYLSAPTSQSKYNQIFRVTVDGNNPAPLEVEMRCPQLLNDRDPLAHPQINIV